MKYCYRCMQELETEEAFCPACGQNRSEEVPSHHLAPGTVLNGKFMVGYAIGEGGFGITYIGRDLNLDMVIAIKEYFPNGLVNRSNIDSTTVASATEGTRKEMFDKGRERFLKEARILAKFSGEAGIVDVRDFFQANNTAYIIMEYLKGKTLKEYLKERGKLPAEEALQLLMPMMQSLKKVHQQGMIHRDIAPDNIMLLEDKVKLLDFGAARDVSNINKSLSVMLKPGFAPEEQYRSKGEQGPWTDVYAICATLYRCITGVTPDDSTQRLFHDELKTPTELGITVNPVFENALMKGLSVLQKDRYQSVDALLRGFAGEEGSTGNTKEFIPYSRRGNDEIAEEGAGGIPASGGFAVPGAVSGSDNSGETKSKKGIVIAAIAGVAVIIIAILLAGLFGKKSKTDTPSENPTEAVSNSENTEPEATKGAEPDVSPTAAPEATKAPSEENTPALTPEPTPTPVAGENLFEYAFELEGASYKLPFAVSEMFANGWSLVGNRTTKSTVIQPQKYEAVTVIRNGRRISVCIYNTTSTEKTLEQCKVCKISVGKDTNASFKLNGYAVLDMTKSELLEKLGAATEYRETENRWEFTYYETLQEQSSHCIEISLYKPESKMEDYSDIELANVVYDEEKKQNIMQVPEFSEELLDFTFELEGVVYQLPCNLQQFTENGWTLNTYGYGDDAFMAGKSEESFSLVKDGKKISLGIYNPSGNASMLRDCIVDEITVALDQDIQFNAVKKASGFSMEEIKAALSEYTPDEYDGSSYVSLTYQWSYLPDAKVKFTFSKEGNRYDEIMLSNHKEVNIDPTETSTERPEYLSGYVAPSGYGSDSLAPVIMLDGVYYRVGVPVSELLKNGWKIVSGRLDVPCGNMENIWLEKDGQILNKVEIGNLDEKQVSVANCFIGHLEVDSADYGVAAFSLYGDVTIGTTEERLLEVLSNEFKVNEYGSTRKYSYTSRDGLEIGIYVNTELNRVERMYIEDWSW